MSQRPCPGCGSLNDENAIYCARCGVRVGGGTCQCGAQLPAESKFCPRCGRGVETTAAAEMGRRAAQREDAGIRWVRGEQSVAARISPSDLLGRLRSGIEVQPGTRALLFLGGRYVGTLQPGRHTLETLTQKLKIPTDGEPFAIVVDDGELGLEFEVPGLFAKDNHNVVLHAQASIRLADPEVFLANLFRDRGTFQVADLQSFLAEEIRQSVRELVATLAAGDLHRGRVRTDVEMELLSRWKATLDRTGFALNRFRVLRFEVPGFETADGLRADAGDTGTVRDAARDLSSALFEADFADLRLEGDQFVRKARLSADIEFEKTKADVDRLQKRQPVLEALMSAGNLEKMSQLKSAEELRVFLLGIDRDHLLSDFERDQLGKDVETQAASAEVKRKFLFDRLQATSRLEMDELQLKGAYQLKLLEMRGDTDVVREQLAREREKLDADLANRTKTHDQMLTERKSWFEQTQFEQKSTADLQMYKVERLSAIHQLEQEKAAARDLQKQVTLAELERKKLAQEGEMYAAMTAEQILSVAVARTPDKATDIAEAFRAMKSGEATERERQLYERVISEVKASNERAQALDHQKFEMSVNADAHHRAQRTALDEQEKDRLEGVAVAGLTADDKKRIPWAHCEIHDLKYQTGRDCPMCRAERKG